MAKNKGSNSGPFAVAFKDVLALDDVKGLLWLSLGGEVLFSQAQDKHLDQVEQEDWGAIGRTLARVNEAEFFYQEDRVYLKKTPSGFLLVWMGGMAMADMVKLNCEVAAASL